MTSSILSVASLSRPIVIDIAQKVFAKSDSVTFTYLGTFLLVYILAITNITVGLSYLSIKTKKMDLFFCDFSKMEIIMTTFELFSHAGAYREFIVKIWLTSDVTVTLFAG